MASSRVAFNAHGRPPEAIRTVYKKYQKIDIKSLEADHDLIDLSSENINSTDGRIRKASQDSTGRTSVLYESLQKFLGSGDTMSTLGKTEYSQWPYEISALPGLIVYPAFFSSAPVQWQLLDTLFHRDLSNPVHQTNVHLHYNLSYPQDSSSFFSCADSGLVGEPKDPSIHKAITTRQLLNKKLRWMTLGGQYDWTNKVYPSSPPPAFPHDVKKLIEDNFPIRAEAAIVNIYSPGDTLSLHRDVSEDCDRPLVSVSIGCDAIFVVGLDGEEESATSRIAALRLRSGDAVLMTGASRFAWHGVPKILEDTCPSDLADWPTADFGGEGNHIDTTRWKGWMRGKRINLNVRQMFD